LSSSVNHFSWKAFLHGEAFPHVLVLGILSLAFITSALLPTVHPQEHLIKTDPSEQVTVGAVSLPEMCIMKQATGLPCPGCGLTRSWISLMHGQWSDSLKHHRFGIAVWGYAVLQILRHLSWLVWPSTRVLLGRLGRWLDWSILGLGAMLVANWAWTLRSLVF